MELRAAHAGIRANQPFLQIPDGAVGHDRSGTFGAATAKIDAYPGSTHLLLVSSAPSPLAPGADPPRNSFFPLGSVMFLPTALFDRSLA